jgi:hypothetical protein
MSTFLKKEKPRTNIQGSYTACYATSSEVIVYTKAQIACLQPVVDAGDKPAAEIYAQVLDLR